MGVVGAVVDAAIGWLVQSILGSFFTDKMEAWARGVGLADDVENLKCEMRDVEMVLAAAEGRRIENKPLAWSLDDLKELVYDAEDVMDELDYYRLQQQIEQGDGCMNPEKSPASSCTPSIFQLACSTASRVVSLVSHGRKRKREEEPIHCTMLPNEIKLDISERINRIVNGLHKLGNSVREVLHLEISSSIATRNQNQYVARNTRLTTSVPIEDKVYGRDAERDKIIELLTNGKSEELQVLPIVGIGGVGKTTLARFVYNDQRVKGHFDLQIWVCVSTNNFDKVRLTREILEYVCTDRQQHERITNFNILQNMLLKNIESKRFLLVLDDMWEDKDISGWGSLLAPLKHNHVPGCMIVATTRRPSVAKMIGTMDPFQVNGLDEKEFWQFFKACAFGDENHEGHPSLQSIGQQIVKELKGCPLAARSVGAVLNRNVSHEHWRTVQKKWKSLQGTNDILSILKLSYDFLPVHLQRCFSYCSLFPEDYKFDGKNLVRVWISQKFVQCKDPTKRLEEIGKQYMDDLVDLGFFQKVDDSHHVMHDLMHELAQMVSVNECATITGSKFEAIQRSVRHVSIITTAYDHVKPFPIRKFEEIVENIGSLEKLRTLVVFGRSSIHLVKFLLTLCKKSKTLRVVRIYVTHDDISSMINYLSPHHLRYLEFIGVSSTTDIWLDIYDKNNIALPQALTKLYHLQFLDASTICNISVPADMNNLVNLRKLDAANEKALLLAIAGVGKLTSLEGLAFRVQNARNFEIKQLQYMNNLVTLEISQLENVKTKEEASGARLKDKEHLEALSLSWNGINMGPDTCTAGRTEDVLEGLQPHDENLKSLRITRYRGATPTWLASTVSFMSLQSLDLENCSEWQILPSLQMLRFLRKLKLIGMQKLMEISIPSLEELVLIDMPKLEKCLGTYRKELTSNLTVLIIKDCPQLNEITLFQSYSSFLAEQHSWFPCLSRLAICNCPHIIKWENLPLGRMQSLKELELIDLHLVRDLSVPSLEKLVLIKMSSLERCSGLTAPPLLPSQEEQEVSLSNLHRLVIHGCPSLMVSRPLPPPSACPSQREIFIGGKLSIIINSTLLNIESNELSVLDDQILAFHDLRCLTSLEIWNCPKLVSISTEGFSQLTSLVSLSISTCQNLLKPPITLDAASESSSSGNIPVLPSLKYLEISSSGIAGGWLTKMLSHLRSLEKLILCECPQIKWLWISQPTEMEGSTSLASATTLSTEDQTILKVSSNILCSLKQLNISGCVDLEFYAGKGGFGGFTTVEEIGIYDCPKLGSLLVSDMAVAFLPPSLKKLSIYGCPKLVSSLVMDTKYDTSTVDVGLLPSSLEELDLGLLPENLQSYFPKGLANLRKLTLMCSPYLKSVQLNSCKALVELYILGCEHLGALEGLQFLTSIRSLYIWNCRQLGALDGLQFLTSLESLEIEMNPVLSAAWDRNPKLQEPEQGGNQTGLLPPSITRLAITNLTNNVQSRLMSYLPAITELTVQKSPELTSLQLGYCTALIKLKIVDCESLTSLQLGCCTTLTKLKVGDCKSLASLHLRYCTALEKLQIRDCESLASIEGFQQFSTNLMALIVATSSSLPPWMEILLQQQGASEVLPPTKLEIWDASVLTMSLCKQLTSLRSLYFNGRKTSPMVSLTEEQERALQLLTSLQQLVFDGYPNLVLLPADLRSLVSLDSLFIWSCPSISRLPKMDSSCCLNVHDCSEELLQLCKEWERRRMEMK